MESYPAKKSDVSKEIINQTTPVFWFIPPVALPKLQYIPTWQRELYHLPMIFPAIHIHLKCIFHLKPAFLDVSPIKTRFIVDFPIFFPDSM